MAAITSANIAQAIVKLVAAKAMPALQNRLVMGSLVNRDFDAVIAATGDTVNVPLPPTMSANNIAEGGSVTTQSPSLGNAQVVLNKHSESSFQIPDITKVLAHPDLLATYLKPAVIAVAESIEQDLLNLYPLLTANTAVGAAATDITEAVVDDAERTLFTAKVPSEEPLSLVVTAAQYSVLRQMARFTEAQTLGDGVAIATGQVGTLKGFRVFRHQLVTTVSTTDYNLAFARDAFVLVTRRLPQPLPGTGAIAEYVDMGNFGFRVVMSYAPSTLAQQFTVDVLYGVASLRNQFGVQVKT